MKYFLLTLCLLLTACENSSRDITHKFKVPNNLADCSITEFTGTTRLVVVRCPNSTTSTNYKHGKTHQTTVVVDES